MSIFVSAFLYPMMLWLGFRRLCNWHAVWHQTGFFSLSKPQFPRLQNKRFFLGGRRMEMPSMKTLVGSYRQHYLVEFFITSNFQVGKLKFREIRWVSSKVKQQEVYDVRSKLWSSWLQAYSCLFGRSTVSLSPKLQSCPILSLISCCHDNETLYSFPMAAVTSDAKLVAYNSTSVL